MTISLFAGIPALLAVVAGGSDRLVEAKPLEKTSSRAVLNADERANLRDRTEVPIAERDKWGKQTASCSFVMMNDLHVSPDAPRDGLKAIMRRLNRMRPDFVVFVGDLNASQSADLATREASLKALMESTRDVAEFQCYYGMGNTDMSPGDDPTAVFRGLAGAVYYSFDHGGVHFVMLYTEKDKPSRFGIVDEAQLSWLRKDLESMKKGAPVVLFGHHALWDDAGKWEKDNWAIENSAELLEVLRPYHLIATFAGHRHLNRMSIDKRGVLHVLNGSMVGDHSDDVGPKHDGIGYRWVRITDDKISTTWVRVGESPVGR